MDKPRHADARAVLSNDAYKYAIAKIGEALENYVKTCKPEDREMAQRVVIAKQIFYGLQREIEKILETPEHKPALREVKKTSVFRR